MSTPELITLTAQRVKEKRGHWKGFYRTEFYKDGVLFATFPAEAKQPRRNIKKITINCWPYKVDWHS